MENRFFEKPILNSNLLPFFCQLEAIETTIWLTEVAPKMGKIGNRFLDHLAKANNDANPNLKRSKEW